MYRDDQKSTALVFEFLSSGFARGGKKAYVELRQLNQLIVKVKEDRNYYNMPFQIYEIGAAFTSQACSKCGNIDPKSRKKEDYHCASCDFKKDADIQASFNILHKWICKMEHAIKDGKKDGVNKDVFSSYLKELKACA